MDDHHTKVIVHRGAGLSRQLLEKLQASLPETRGAISEDLRWLLTLKDGLGHDPLLIEAQRGGDTVGLLPLVLVRSTLFGRFLVSMPYLNSGGVRAINVDIAEKLIDRSVKLAETMRVKHLELRHESPCEHPALTKTLTSKVHMRLALPETSQGLWDAFKPKVRNQIRKGEKQGFQVSWGGEEQLDDFYEVFTQNMRDLGTPAFGKALFRGILRHFSDEAEHCVLRLDGRPIAAALLLHGSTTTEVPSASSLRALNASNANMFMYWQLLQRAIARGQSCFDFGRSTRDSNTFRFKKQWGAKPESAVWQYHVRRGDVGDMRPERGRYQLAIRIWRRLPLAVTRLLGPSIASGIP